MNKKDFCIGAGIGAVCASIACSVIWSLAIDKLRDQAIERGYATMTNPDSLPKFQRFVWIDQTRSEMRERQSEVVF